MIIRIQLSEQGLVYAALYKLTTAYVYLSSFVLTKRKQLSGKVRVQRQHVVSQHHALIYPHPLCRGYQEQREGERHALLVLLIKLI